MTAWVQTVDDSLCQGEFLRECSIPAGQPEQMHEEPSVEEELVAGLIVLTHSCDLANSPLPEYVSLCSLQTLEEFRAYQPQSNTKWNNFLNSLAKGQVQGLRLLPPLNNDFESKDHFMIADYRTIFSLKYNELLSHALDLGARPKLASPYLEYFSQGLGAYFSRVGLSPDLPRWP